MGCLFSVHAANNHTLPSSPETFIFMPQVILICIAKHSFHIASYQKFPYTVIHTGIIFLTARHQNLPKLAQHFSKEKPGIFCQGHGQ